MVAGVAFGAAAQDAPQPGRPTKQAPVRKPPPATTPAGPATPAEPEQAAPKREEPEVGPYVTQTMPRDLMLRVHVRVNSDAPNEKITYRDPFTGETVNMPVIRPFEFQTLAMVFPLIPSTASSDPYPKDFKGQLRLNDLPADESPQFMTGYPGGIRLARFDANEKAQATTCRQVELTLEIPMRCYRTAYDEAGALLVRWPEGPWPKEAASVQSPQLYIETGVDATGTVRPYDDAVLKTAVARWLAEEKISDPRGVNPAALAKMLTGKVWGAFQPDREGMSFKRTGELSGVMLQPPAYSLESGRGSTHDMAVLLAAVLRSVGLPTRVVVGYDVGPGDEKYMKRNKANELRSWVEFCLYNEDKNTINWVPIDIARLRASSSRPMPLTRLWKHFGTSDELNSVTPFAFHFHPPTDVVSYGWPGFWGWFVTPKPPENAEQAIRFTAMVMPSRGGQPPRDPKKKDETTIAPTRGY
ncbi:MAG: hypothetical protein HBSAPP03_10990 [Phycisphaerae bacterium]|nr:MAG: hypothetical protein HBSAPP03_10990 [Phycisphaerae bacterium]